MTHYTCAMQCSVRLELASSGGQGSPGGRLRVYTAAGKLAASSTSPGIDESLKYSVKHQAWVWTASSQWSLLFMTKETCSKFEGRLLLKDLCPACYRNPKPQFQCLNYRGLQNCCGPSIL